MKTIPQIRESLLEITNNNIMLPATKRQIRGLVKQMYRRPAVRRAPREHAKMTAALSLRIETYARANPHSSYAAIGRVFNVAIGRVSEILAGKRAA